MSGSLYSDGSLMPGQGATLASPAINLPFSSADRDKLAKVDLAPTHPAPQANIPTDRATQPAIDHDTQAKQYIDRTMQLEGAGKDPNSSAVGGFINSTWLNLMHDRMPATQEMPDAQVLAMRSDPKLRAQMTAAYASDNAGYLKQFGIPVDNTNLRLAHWFGPQGAVQVLGADPNTPMDRIFGGQVIAANPVLQGKTAGEVIDLTARQMSEPPLRDFWTSSTGALMGQRSAATQETRARMDALLGKYMETASKAAPGSKEREEAIDALLEHRMKMEEKFGDIIKHPPTEKPVDAWQNFGSAAVIVGLLGGLFSRQHATAALNAAGTALQAINDNNHQQYENSYKTWERQADLTSKMLSMENEDIRTILDQQRLSIQDKQQALSNIAQMYQMTELAGRLQTGDIDAQMQQVDRQIAIQKQFDDQRTAVEHWQKDYDLREKVANQRGTKLFTGRDDSGNEITFSMVPGRPDTAIDAQGNPITPPKLFREASKEYTPRGIQGALYEDWKRGFTTDNKRPPTPAEERVWYTSLNTQNTASRAFATGKQGDAVRSFNVAIDHLAVIEELVSALDNKDEQTFNAVKNRLRTEFGDPIVVAFNAAAPVVGAEISKAVIGAVGALTDREEVRKSFQDKNSPEQLRVPIEYYKRLMAGQLNGYERQFKNSTGGSAEDFDRMLSDDAKRELRNLPKAGGGAAGSGGEVIQNGWRYDATTHEPIGPVQQ